MSDPAPKRYPCKYCGGAHTKAFVPWKCIEQSRDPWFERLAADILNFGFEEWDIARQVLIWEGEGGR